LTDSREQKAAGREDFSRIPGGVPGVEERLGLLLTYGVRSGRLSLEQLVELLSANPARLYGLYPRKGALLPGSDADVVIWDPALKRVLRDENVHTAAGYTAYRGREIHGGVDTVFLRGQAVVERGRIVDERRGVFIPRTLGTL
jgi:dihydropyrimidinase